MHVSFNVTNTGTVPGATVAQLYAAPQFTVRGRTAERAAGGLPETPVLRPGQTAEHPDPVKSASLTQWDEQPLKRSSTTGPTSSRWAPDSATVAGSGTVAVDGAITPKVQYVTVQPDQVVFKPGDTLDLTGKNPWIADDTNASLEQPRAADNIVEAVNNDQSFADLSQAKVALRQQRPQRRHGQRRRHGHHGRARRDNDQRDRQRRHRQHPDRRAAAVQLRPEPYRGSLPANTLTETATLPKTSTVSQQSSATGRAQRLDRRTLRTHDVRARGTGADCQRDLEDHCWVRMPRRAPTTSTPLRPTRTRTA